MQLEFSNGEYYISYNVQFMDESTSLKIITGINFKEIEVKDIKALVSERNLDMQIGDVLYSFYENETIKSDELIKIAKSLK